MVLTQITPQYQRRFIGPQAVAKLLKHHAAFAASNHPEDSATKMFHLLDQLWTGQPGDGSLLLADDTTRRGGGEKGHSLAKTPKRDCTS